MSMDHSIKTGMAVYDRAGEKIGTIAYVHTGDSAEITPTYDLDQTFADRPDLPEDIKERYLRYGYIRIYRGALRSDALATFEHIIHVQPQKLMLNLTEQDIYTI